QAPENAGTGSVSRRLGTWYRFLFRRFQHPAYQAFRTAAANCIVQIHDGPIDARMRDLHALATVKKEWFSVAEAARELGVRSERLAAGVDDGRIQASVPDSGTLYRQRFLHRSEIERLRAIRDDFCDDNAAAKFLGVPHSVFGILKEAGLIQPVDDADLPPVTRGCVSHSALQALAARLLAERPVLDPSAFGLVALRDLNLRRTTDRQRLVSLFRAIADGAVAPVGHDGTGSAGGVLLSKEDVQTRIASFSFAADLTMQQVSDLVGVHYDAVKVWVDSGLLPACRAPDRQGRPLVIELRDLVAFLLEFSPLSCLAAQMGSSSRGITDTLSRRQVSVMGKEAKRGVLVRIRDMVHAEASTS
ncbi:MAG: helix-turn-helix domain-containing protein, partial [Variovorax sp.]|nr:helix-turn-helix domain-containing protein [Variovorax sp.]